MVSVQPVSIIVGRSAVSHKYNYRLTSGLFVLLSSAIAFFQLIYRLSSLGKRIVIVCISSVFSGNAASIGSSYLESIINRGSVYRVSCKLCIGKCPVCRFCVLYVCKHSLDGINVI